MNKSCVRCYNPNSNLQCTRCDDFYCSVRCQRSDWQSHRYICFPIPQLKVSQDVETESKYSKIPIFSEKFEVPKPDTKPTKIEAKSCDIVKIPKRDADKLAKEIQEKNLRDRNMKEIHEIIDKKTMTIQPELRLDFKSHHVQKPDATKSIKFLNASSIMTTPDVNLDIPSTSNFKVMNPEKGKGKPLIYTMDFLEKDSWIDNVNHQISITLLDTSMLLTDNIFTSYQAGKKYSKLYKEIANAINSNFLNCPKLKEIPIEGQLVLAKFQQKYYRAMVLEIKESEIVVVYIDFGNTKMLQLTDLREFSSKFSQKMVAQLCYAYDEGENYEKFYEKTTSPGTILKVRVMDSNPDINIVEFLN